MRNTKLLHTDFDILWVTIFDDGVQKNGDF